MLIKVCGMRDHKNIRAVSELGIDLIGIIFWEKSPRCMQNHQIPDLDSRIKKVGIFVDALSQVITNKINELHLNYIQLHGNESATYIDSIRKKIGPDVGIIKAISIHNSEDISKWHEYEGHVDMLLFDTKCKCAGGSGEQFDWSLLDQYDGNIPFLLSGGIGSEDAKRINDLHLPKLIGIDLNSRFEDAPGIKNIDKLRNFIRTIRNEQDK